MMSRAARITRVGHNPGNKGASAEAVRTTGNGRSEAAEQEPRRRDPVGNREGVPMPIRHALQYRKLEFPRVAISLTVIPDVR